MPVVRMTGTYSHELNGSTACNETAVQTRPNTASTFGRKRKRRITAEIAMLTSVPTTDWPSVTMPTTSRTNETAVNPIPRVHALV